VVPYNPYLSLTYNCHINVEVCTSVKSVKYLFKYIYKGHDCATVRLDTLTRNESALFLDTRYISAPEAIWRIRNEKMHDWSHAIKRLALHLEDMQPVYFHDGQEDKAVVDVMD